MDIRDVVTTIVAITIGVILVGSLLVPMAADQITSIGEMDISGASTWATLLGVVVVVTILSLVVVALYNFTNKN